METVLKESTKNNFKSNEPANLKSVNFKPGNLKPGHFKPGNSNAVNFKSDNSENETAGLTNCSPNHLLKIIDNLKQENKQKDAKISKFIDQIQDQNEYIAEHIVETDELQEALKNVREQLDISERTKSTTEAENTRLENQLSLFQLQVLEMEDKLKEVEFESKRSVAVQGSKTRRPSYTESVPLEYRITEAEKLLKRHPNCIPVILEPPQEGSSMANQLQFNGAKFQRKLLMPADITFRECCVRVKKHLLDSNAIRADPARDALYFYINRNFATCLMNETLSTIYKIHRHSDGFLYVNFAKEATFGMDL